MLIAIPNLKMKHNSLLFALILLALLGSPAMVLSQVGVGANFGVEAEAYSGDVISGVNTDDWFYNTVSGAGVIDEAAAASMGYAAQLAAGNNISFDLRQSIPNYASNNGYIWYSTRYARDYVSLISDDQTLIITGKNGDNPQTSWGLGSGTIPSKTDIVDAAVHMRRDGVNVTDDLWVNLMISTLSSSGNHFIDFELFVSEIQASGSGFINSGTQEGHTAWEFDGSGNVTQIGDMVIGFSYSGGGVSGVEVRLWVDRSIFNPGSSPGGTAAFTWGVNIDGGSTYGYGQIVVPPGSLLSNVNPILAQGPPWGTTNTSGYSANFNNDYFAEVALNFTRLGFDPLALFGAGAACDSPFSALMAKSRTSSAFTSSLKDFAGPLDFLGSAEDTQVNTALVEPVSFDSCIGGETRVLQAEFSSASAEYTWYSLTPGVVFPSNGLDTISGLALDSVVIDTPGEYQLGIAPLLGCDPYTNDSNIIGVWSIPCPQADAYTLVKNNTMNTTAPGVLNNDTDNDPADVLTVTTTPEIYPSNGTLTLFADGSFDYVPNPGYVGTDQFSYEVCDSHGLCDTELVNLTIVSASVITNRRITYRVKQN